MVDFGHGGGDERKVKRRRLSIALAVLLLVAVGVVIYVDRSGDSGGPATTQVRGVIGSEKVAFFRDQRVVRPQ
ncbi:hypothetical protein ACFQ1S_34435 [Kibdelosporangium lantanae]|uniref:Uncharacterized protein n=1 Tax=Kibdelosporangium lantanae TaxID=1497396 RepID=A0ABW3MJB5_9PSEU